MGSLKPLSLMRTLVEMAGLDLESSDAVGLGSAVLQVPRKRPGSGHRDAVRPFELRVLALAPVWPWRAGVPACAVPALRGGAPQQRGSTRPGRRRRGKIAELGGSTLRVVADHVMEALHNGYKPPTDGAGRREPFTWPRRAACAWDCSSWRSGPSQDGAHRGDHPGHPGADQRGGILLVLKCTGGPAVARRRGRCGCYWQQL